MKTKETTKFELPTITSYGDYESKNYGVNSLCVDLPGIRFYYSYKTIVAYRDFEDGLVCRQNDWATTTGKHLNWIQPDKKLRKPSEEFESMLAAALARHFVV